jgi:hypothetical protein
MQLLQDVPYYYILLPLKMFDTVLTCPLYYTLIIKMNKAEIYICYVTPNGLSTGILISSNGMRKVPAHTCKWVHHEKKIDIF